MTQKPTKIINPGGLHIPAYGTPVPGGEGRSAGLVVDPGDPRVVYVAVDGGPDLSVSEWDRRVEREQWRASPEELVLTRSERFRKLSAPRDRRTDQVENLYRQAAITRAHRDAALVFAKDFALANESQIRAMDHAVERVSGGGSKNIEQERQVLRMDAQNRLEAARAYLREETAIDLDHVAVQVIIHNVALHVLLGGKPPVPGEKRTVNNGQSAKGTLAVQVALDRLAAFYGLGPGVKARTKRQRKNSSTRSYGSKATRAA